MESPSSAVAKAGHVRVLGLIASMFFFHDLFCCHLQNGLRII